MLVLVTVVIACAFWAEVQGRAQDAVGGQPQPKSSFPAWAYPFPSESSNKKEANIGERRVPGSTVAYTAAQVNDPFLSPDWHPDAHPKMPEVVVHGRKPGVLACGYCHRAEGTGGPENSSVAGLPYAYIVQQLQDYKDGSRSTAVPEYAPQKNMIQTSQAANEKEIAEAASYFAALKPKQNIRVIEAERIPKMYVPTWLYSPLPGNETELLGERIIEVPDNLEQFEDRDSQSTFTAYVPKGSQTEGEALVYGKVAGKGVACSACHGTKLTGAKDVPSIAGRSPTYIVRQLYEFQNGSRHGKNAVLMRPTVAELTSREIIAIAAYLGSRPPN